jgi:hypothetical protein
MQNSLVLVELQWGEMVNKQTRSGKEIMQCFTLRLSNSQLWETGTKL